MGIFSKLKTALTRSSNKISGAIDSFFSSSKLDEKSLEELEDILISSDVGISLSSEIIKSFKSTKFKKEASLIEIKKTLASKIEDLLQYNQIENSSFFKESLKRDENGDPYVIMLSGVNGNGKTTTIGKLANLYLKAGKKVAFAPCDRFRAGAAYQLSEIANLVGVSLYENDSKDPASVAYNACLKAKEDNIDILMIDTAGRLQNYSNLMDELSKIIRVIQKIIPSAPSQSIQVIDASTGQNAIDQAEKFKEVAKSTGFIVTKLDSSSKAGFILNIIYKFKLPIFFLGVGEKMDDIIDFNIKDFISNLLDIEQNSVEIDQDKN